MGQDEAIRRALTYLADALEGATTSDQRAQVRGVPADAALDIAAAVFVGMLKQDVPGPAKPFAASVIRGLVEVQDMRAWFELEAPQ